MRIASLVLLLALAPPRAGELPPASTSRAAGVEAAIEAAGERGGRILRVGDEQRASFATIQSAVNASASGDLVLVHPGVYRERVLIAKDNPADRPLVVMAAAGGVIIDGEGKHICVEIGGDHVVLDGFECRNAHLQRRHPNSGTISLFGADGVVVENCFCHDASDEYKVADIATTSAPNFVIRNNRCASEISHSIDIGWKSTDGIVEHNELSGSYSAIYVHVMADRTTVRYNTAYDFMGGGALKRDRWHGSGVVCRDNVGASIHHNLFIGPQASGVLLYDFEYAEHGPGMPGEDQPNESHAVFNNTVVGPSLFGIELSGNVEGCRIEDNLIVGATRAAIRAYHVPSENRTNLLFRNVWWDCEKPLVDEGGGRLPSAPLIEADPAFADPEGGDFRPADGSPAAEVGAFAPEKSQTEGEEIGR